MKNKSIQSLLDESFSSANREDWLKAASQELQGKNPFTALNWKASDDFTFSPYYDHETTHSLNFLKSFQLAEDDDFKGSARAWINLPQLTVVDEVKANRLALQFLNQGADGIYFNLHKNKTDNLEALLHNVEWPYCHLSFEISSTECKKLADFIKKKNYADNSLSGAFFWNNIELTDSLILQDLISQKKIYALGLVISPSTPVQEISSALTNAVKAIDALTEQNIPAASVIQRVAFSLEAGTNFLLTIAKFKALRMLWFQITQAYGVNHYHPSHLHIHGRSGAWVNEKFQPHGAMLKNTTAAMACVFGGCNAIRLQPEDENNVMMNRMALNVSNILREESHFNKVADPVAGSYAIENMINEIAEKAWSKFKLQIASDQY